MSSHSGGGSTTFINFSLLALIRGTTPLMSFLAVTRLNAASLVVTLKCAISLLLFLVTLIANLMSNNAGEFRLQLRKNVKSGSTYWKLLVIGILQGTAPHLLVVYSLQYLPPTLTAVFMTAAPWFTIIFERCCFIKIKTKVTSIVIIGIILGMLGIFLTVGPAVHESLVFCKDFQIYSNKTGNQLQLNRTYKSAFPYDVCLSTKGAILGIVSLIGASWLWSIGIIFWRSHRSNIHFILGSIGQNFVGTVVSFIIWYTCEKHLVVGEVFWDDAAGTVGFIFLGVISGWLGILLLRLLSTKIGGKSTNLVLVALPVIAFVEDCLFVKDVITSKPWIIAIEVIGLLLVSLGALLTYLPLGKKKGHGPLSETLLQSEFTEDTTHDDEDDYRAEVAQYDTFEEEEEEEEDEEDDNEIITSQDQEGLLTKKENESELRECSEII